MLTVEFCRFFMLVFSVQKAKITKSTSIQTRMWQIGQERLHTALVSVPCFSEGKAKLDA